MKLNEIKSHQEMEALYEDVQANMLDATLTEEQVLLVDDTRLTREEYNNFIWKYRDILNADYDRRNEECIKEHGMSLMNYQLQEAQAEADAMDEDSE